MPPQDPNRQPNLPPPVAPTPRNPGQPVSSTPYDFIMDSNLPNKSGPGPKKGSKLLYVAIIGIIIVVILFSIVLFTSGGSSSKAEYLTVAQEQTEMIRIADEHYGDLQDASTKAFVINTQLSLLSSQADFLKFLSSNGAGIDQKQLGGAFDAQTDTQLTAAQGNGNIDGTLKDVLVTDLTTYQQHIRAAFNATDSQAARAELQKLFDQAALLLEQAKP